jgi:hypothetical protein
MIKTHTFQKGAVMRYLFLIICLISGLYGQSADEIKNSGKYLWGEGRDRVMRRADDKAIKDILSQISMEVESKFSHVIEENNEDIHESTEVIVNTYSTATLHQAQRKVDESADGSYIVLRYIEKTNVSKIFADRMRKVFDYANSGWKADRDNRVGDALKYYFWSLALLRSHPDVNELRGDVGSHQNLLLITWLPSRIESILKELDISIDQVVYNKDERRRSITLNVERNGQPVQNLDFIYYTGDSWTNFISSCKDGRGIAEYAGIAAQDVGEVRIKIEYMYEQKSRADLELYNVMEQTSLPYYASADLKIPVSKIRNRAAKPKAVEPVIVEAPHISPTPAISPGEKEAANDPSQCVMNVIKAIGEGNFSNLEGCFTEQGKKIFTDLLQYGQAELIDNGRELKLQMSELNGQLIFRSVPMKFTFPENQRVFIEDVVFILNKKGQIDALAFALNKATINDIMTRSEDFATLEQKQQTIRFLEDYKTAYALRRIDYLEAIFADNALILVGQALKPSKKNIDHMYKNLKNEDVQYIRLTKSEYMERVARIFRMNEFVNIQFEEAYLKKIGKDKNVFGIQIAQNYYSENYADFGYLFLMFDLTDVKEPQIHVRSWQPEKNAEGRIMGLEDFVF